MIPSVKVLDTFSDACLLGGDYLCHPVSRFCLPDGYVTAHPLPFDDTPNTDEWQSKVYELARACLPQQLNKEMRVIDWGCGSGYKLRKYFSGCSYVGVDVPDTVWWLTQQYPDDVWRTSCDMFWACNKWELMIAADVIEHLVDPAGFLRDVFSYTYGSPNIVVLSTPNRSVVRGNDHLGPPPNPHHAQEWDFWEFRTFVGAIADAHGYRLWWGSPLVGPVEQGTMVLVVVRLDYNQIREGS